MKLPWLTALATVAPLLTPARAPAQPLFRHERSIECTVANADTVVVGLATRTEGGADPASVTIAVEETLKGEHHDRLHFRLPSAVHALAGDRGPARVLVAARGGTPEEVQVIDLTGTGPEVLSDDFTVLRQPRDVVVAARAAIRRMPGVRRIETFRLAVPYPVMAGTRWEKLHGRGMNATLEVPVDERLQERALRAIGSKNLSERAEGARALRFFRSDANVARVRPLLADPDWAHGSRAEDNRGHELRVYLVREAAYQTLAYWGVKADEPVTREQLWMPERVRHVDLSNSKVSDADLDGLTRFEHLEDLYLRNEPMTDARLKRLAGLRGLRSLDLGGTGVTDVGLKELAGMTRLRHLSLRGTKVTGTGLHHLAALTGLASLDLGQTDVTDASIGHLAGLPALETLDLSGTGVSADAVTGLLGRRPGLKVTR